MLPTLPGLTLLAVTAVELAPTMRMSPFNAMVTSPDRESPMLSATTPLLPSPIINRSASKVNATLPAMPSIDEEGGGAACAVVPLTARGKPIDCLVAAPTTLAALTLLALTPVELSPRTVRSPFNSMVTSPACELPIL